MIIFGAAIMMVFSSWCGTGLTFDSYDYLAAASSFREQQELLNADRSPFIFHAPFFPIFLSLLGDQPMPIIKYTNLVFLLLSLILIGSIVWSQISNRWIFVVCMLAIGMAAGVQMIHQFIWSEPLFLALFALHNVLLIRYLSLGYRGDFYGLIVAAFFLAITRNSGFFIILPGSILLFLYSDQRKIGRALVYLVFGSSGFAAWNVYVTLHRNGAELIYRDNPFFTDFWSNVVNYLDTISLWFFPSLVPLAIRILLLLAVGVFLVIYFRKYMKDKIVGAMGIQSLFYIVIMIVLLAVDPDETERLLAVIYPWVIIWLCLLLDRLYEIHGPQIKRVLIIGMLLWVSYVVIRGVNNNLRWHRDRCQEHVSHDQKIMDE